jgi:GR25 family glycosyltransferase involved in LPS biosynthesis
MQEHTGLNKLDGFGPIYVINLDRHLERKNYMVNQFQEHGLSNYSFIKAVDGVNDTLDNILLLDKLAITRPEIGCTVSHLTAIKNWLDTSDSEHAVIMEDDISFETVQYWKFNWKNFISNVRPFDVLQLSIIHNYNINTNLHIREANDWSTGVYVISRNWAKKLIAKHYVDEKFNLYMDRSSVADILIYHSAKSYSAPLFVTNTGFESSINQNHTSTSHTRSYIQVTEFWKSMNLDAKANTSP